VAHVNTHVDRIESNGDGTLTIYGVTDDHNHCHIHIGRDVFEGEHMLTLLQLAGQKVDGKAQSLATQQELEGVE
jgi:hypothetical protein